MHEADAFEGKSRALGDHDKSPSTGRNAIVEATVGFDGRDAGTLDSWRSNDRPVRSAPSVGRISRRARARRSRSRASFSFAAESSLRHDDPVHFEVCHERALVRLRAP